MFATRLKELRKSRGITQEQLAAIIGVERSSVGKYEGKSKIIPSDDVKDKIASFFGVSIDYLLGRTEDSTIPAESVTNNESFPSLSPIALDIARKYDQLDARGQQAISTMMAFELNYASQEFADLDARLRGAIAAQQGKERASGE